VAGRLVDVFALYLCTTNDTSGNPRRGWVVFRSGVPSAFVWEGYKGDSALAEYLGLSFARDVAGSWYRVQVAPSEFRNWVKKCKDWDGVEVINN
jgi:hypothetical protein